MQVTDHQVDIVSMPVTHDEHAAVTLSTYVILRLRTDEGIEGLGLGRTTKGGATGFLETLDGYIEQLRGRDLMLTQRITGVRETRYHEPPGLFYKGAGRSDETRALSLLDVALWDLKGKVTGLPIYQLMGGFSDRAPCYASWRVEPVSEGAELQERARFLVDQGHTSMKFHVRHLDAKGLITHMRTLREAVGPDVGIMVDAYHKWDVKEAIAMGRALEPYDPYWIEDPISFDDYDGMREVREAVSARICSGEHYTELAEFRRLIAARSVDIVMVDPNIGGLTGLQKVAQAAEVFGLPFVTHLATEITAHAIAAAPNGQMVEYIPWANPLFREPYALEDGHLVMPDRPGLGLELDEEAVQRFRLN